MAANQLATFPLQETGRLISEKEQVAIALHPRLMGQLLEKEFGPDIEETFDRRKPPACHILDTKYEPGDYCMVLYEWGDQLAIGFFHWGEAENPIPEASRIIPSLGMQIYLFPNDPALPSLIKAMNPEAISEALSQALPSVQTREERILRSRVNLLRFRPGRRCTVRVDLWLRKQETGVFYHRVFFGKIYHDLEKARNVYQEMLQLSSSIPNEDCRISLATASLFLPDLSMVLQDPMPGESLDSFIDCYAASLDPRGLAGTLKAAAALAALHTSGLSAGRIRPIEKELARFKKRANKIGQVNPTLGEEIFSLADALAGWLNSLQKWGAMITIVHGDCKPAQFLISDDQVALIDFDHCGMADHAVDVGTFLATLQQLKVLNTIKNHGKAPRGTGWLPGLKEQFLDAYCKAGNFPASFKLRAIWYESVGLLRKAIRSFERSPQSIIPLALIAEAQDLLNLLPPPGLF